MHTSFNFFKVLFIILIFIGCQKQDSVLEQPTSQSFDGSEGRSITIKQAEQYIDNYARQHEGDESMFVKSHFFGRDIIETLLKNPDAVGIRIHYALDKSDKPKLLLYAAAKDMKNLKTAENKNKDAVNDSDDCPNHCPIENDLGTVNNFASLHIAKRGRLNTKIGGFITKEVSKDWINRYIKNKESKGKPFVQSSFYGRKIIQKLLSTKGAIGIRMYYGLTLQGGQKLVLTAEDAQGKILRKDRSYKKAEGSGVVNASEDCPESCP